VNNMTATEIIERLLRLMTMRSVMLQLEWDTVNAKYDNALEKAFGSLESAKVDAFITNYQIGYITAKEKSKLSSMLRSKMPRVDVRLVELTPPIPGTEKWGTDEQHCEEMV